MALHDIEIRHDGIRHRGIIRGSVTLGMEQIAHPFDFFYAESLGEHETGAWYLFRGDFIEFLVDGEYLTDGHVFKSRISQKVKELSFDVAGRARTADFVDGIVTLKPRQMNHATVPQIATKILRPYGFTVHCESPGEPLPRFTVDKSETAFEAISRACRLRGLWPRYAPGDSSGSVLVLERLDDSTSPTPITLGENCIEITREGDDTERFSEYIFAGHTKVSDRVSPAASRFRTRVLDPGVNRYRPTRAQTKTAQGPSDAGVLAQLDRNHRAGNSETFSAVMSGWKTYEGELWRPNSLHAVYAPALGLNGSRLLITEVRYAWDVHMERGFVAELTLKRRETFDHELNYPTTEGLEFR